MLVNGVEARTEIARACGTEIPFGKYRGQTIARAGASDDGLAYLKWMFDHADTMANHPYFTGMLNLYLTEPSIAKRLETLGLDEE